MCVVTLVLKSRRNFENIFSLPPNIKLVKEIEKGRSEAFHSQRKVYSYTGCLQLSDYIVNPIEKVSESPKGLSLCNF